MYPYSRLILLCSRNQCDIVKQLYSNKKIKKQFLKAKNPTTVLLGNLYEHLKLVSD